MINIRTQSIFTVGLPTLVKILACGKTWTGLDSQNADWTELVKRGLDSISN